MCREHASVYELRMSQVCTYQAAESFTCAQVGQNLFSVYLELDLSLRIEKFMESFPILSLQLNINQR